MKNMGLSLHILFSYLKSRHFSPDFVCPAFRSPLYSVYKLNTILPMRTSFAFRPLTLPHESPANQIPILRTPRNAPDLTQPKKCRRIFMWLSNGYLITSVVENHLCMVSPQKSVSLTQRLWVEIPPYLLFCCKFSGDLNNGLIQYSKAVRSSIGQGQPL